MLYKKKKKAIHSSIYLLNMFVVRRGDAIVINTCFVPILSHSRNTTGDQEIEKKWRPADWRKLSA